MLGVSEEFSQPEGPKRLAQHRKRRKGGSSSPPHTRVLSGSPSKDSQLSSFKTDNHATTYCTEKRRKCGSRHEQDSTLWAATMPRTTKGRKTTGSPRIAQFPKFGRQLKDNELDNSDDAKERDHLHDSDATPAIVPTEMEREDSHPFASHPTSPAADIPFLCTTPTSRSPSIEGWDDQGRPCTPTYPMAPRRSHRRRWLDALLNNNTSLLESELVSGAADAMSSEVFVEWIQWDDQSEEVTDSEFAWVQPVLLAARWSSPQTISLLLKHGFSFQAHNHLGQNALACLCSQPRASVEFVEALRGHFCPDALKADRPMFPSFPRHPNGQDEHSSEDIEMRETFESLLQFRNREMGLVAQLLLFNGVDALSPDYSGRCAVDYARAFQHQAILEAFAGIGKTPKKVREGSRKQHVKVAPLCNTPTREAVNDLSVSASPKADLISTPVNLAQTPAPRYDGISPNCDSGYSMASLSSTLPTGYDLTVRNAKRRGSRFGTKGAPSPFPNPKHDPLFEMDADLDAAAESQQACDLRASSVH